MSRVSAYHIVKSILVYCNIVYDGNYVLKVMLYTISCFVKLRIYWTGTLTRNS